jgi:hypothetical protein
MNEIGESSLEDYKKSKSFSNGGILNEKKLTKICESFYNGVLFNMISMNFLEGESSILERMKGTCKLESNSILVKYKDLTDMINLYIYAEKKILDDGLDKILPNMRSISDIVEKKSTLGPLNEKIVNEDTYSYADFLDFFKRLSYDVGFEVDQRGNTLYLNFN